MALRLYDLKRYLSSSIELVEQAGQRCPACTYHTTEEPYDA